MESKQKNFTYGRINLPGFKGTDYFLFKMMRDHFHFDTRQLFVLGLRWLYAAYHDPVMREMLLGLMKEIRTENLDQEITPRPVYKTFEGLTKEPS